MKTFKRISIALAVTLLASVAFSSCALIQGNESSEAENNSVTESFEENEYIKAVSPKHNTIKILANEQVAEYAAGYAVGMSAAYDGTGDRYFMDGITLEWETSEIQAHSYTVALSTNSDLSDAVEYTVEETQLHIDDLFVAYTYYWQITAHCADKEQTSAIYKFRTAKTPRTIQMDKVSNTRDIGGYMTTSGRQVKQGMAYRGAYLDEILETGKTQALEIYKIRTDLDLRKGGEGSAGGVSPLGENINYVHYSCPYYLGGSTGINVVANHANLAAAIKTFADADNYPIFYHCSVGRDRTGMVSMILLCLLGVSEQDIMMDYELSFFSYRGTLDGADLDYMMGVFKGAYDYVATFGGAETPMQGCENYLKVIGVSEEEIATIRNLLLE